MAMVVQHNLTAMNANRMLGITTGQQAKSSEKLSSGYKINRAADDAAGLSISEKMRKQIRGLSQASDNAQDGISVVQTAEGALAEVHDMLQRMNELAVKASNETNSESDRKSIQDEIDQLVAEVDRVSETTKFNETYLLKGDKAGAKAKDFAYKDANTTTTTLYKLAADGMSFETIAKGTFVDSLATDAKYFTNLTPEKAGEAFTTTTVFSATTAVINTDNYYQKDGDGNYILVEKGSEFSGTTTDYYQVTFGADGEVASAVQVTQNPVTTTGYELSTDIWDKNGNKIEAGTILTTVSTTNVFSTLSDISFNTADAVTLANYTTTGKVQFTDSNGNEIAENGLDAYLDENGNLKEGQTLYLNGDEASAEDIKKLVDSSRNQDTGALSLQLHVGADATANNEITLTIDSMSAKSLGVDGLSVAGKDNANSLDAIETISAALSKVSAQRSSLGAVQNRLEHTINNLDNVVENTTSAESQIRDTDMAEEMVNYSKNNILAQAGQSMLAQANQSTQGVLSLLG